jgi:aspartyl-tRNA(Asn)/glutamyl-tRNA(Gln) amidotransferase subunit A
LCGLFGLKPTYGRLSRAGSFPFVDAFDHLGPIARSVEDLALSFDAMQGWDPDDPVCTDRPADVTTQVLNEGIGPHRHCRRLSPAAVARGSRRWPRSPRRPMPRDRRHPAGRRGAFGGLHHHRHRGPVICRACAGARGFDPDARTPDGGGIATGLVVRQGAALPATIVPGAAVRQVDVILAPATPCTAQAGQVMMKLGGVELPVRANLGLYTQPISFIGLPVVVAPLQKPGGLPIGVQIIANHYKEEAALRVAHHLEKHGVASARQREGLRSSNGHQHS